MGAHCWRPASASPTSNHWASSVCHSFVELRQLCTGLLGGPGASGNACSSFLPCAPCLPSRLQLPPPSPQRPEGRTLAGRDVPTSAQFGCFLSQGPSCSCTAEGAEAWGGVQAGPRCCLAGLGVAPKLEGQAE